MIRLIYKLKGVSNFMFLILKNICAGICILIPGIILYQIMSFAGSKLNLYELFLKFLKFFIALIRKKNLART